MPHRSVLLGVNLLVLTWLAGPRADADGFPAAQLQPYANRPITRVVISGNRVTRPHVIERELASRAGRPLDVVELRQDVQRLENLGIFSAIEIVALPDADGVAIELHLREMPALIPFPAVQYNEQNGFSFGGGVASNNLTGRHVSLNARALFGGAETHQLKLNVPWIAGNHLSVRGTVAHLVRDDELNEFEETSDEITPSFGTWLGRRGRLGVSLSYFRMSSDTPGKTLSSNSEDDLYRAGLSLGWDSRDSWRNPRSGWLSQAEGWRSVGDADFWTLSLDLRRYLPARRGQTLVLGTLLSLQTGSVGSDLPGYLQYRIGGANSVRGHPVEEGKEIFGKNQWLATLEYEFPLLELREVRFVRWGVSLGLDLVVFADTGVAWSEPAEFRANRFRSGVGAGLRLLVPGSEMLRFELALGDRGNLEFHFAGGSKLQAQTRRLR